MDSILTGVIEHYEEALTIFPKNRIVGIFLQGSQNYGLQTEYSDIDTKLVVVPTFEEIAFNKSPISTTHIRANNEHIDFKDLRLMLGTFRKQNLNFLEILFTDYKILNEKYKDLWQNLIDNREKIAHYNIYSAVKAMKGVALEKYFAMEHEYPSKVEVLKKFGYDPKQLHHLLRVEEFLRRYIEGENYERCMKPSDSEYLIEVKLGKYNLEDARIVAKQSLDAIERLCAPITKGSVFDRNDVDVDELLDKVQLEIMRRALGVQEE